MHIDLTVSTLFNWLLMKIGDKYTQLLALLPSALDKEYNTIAIVTRNLYN